MQSLKVITQVAMEYCDSIGRTDPTVSEMARQNIMQHSQAINEKFKAMNDEITKLREQKPTRKRNA